ncbi:MAG: hypothetical protein ACI9JP_000700, partial [Granulosicoccus sp.]
MFWIHGFDKGGEAIRWYFTGIALFMPSESTDPVELPSYMHVHAKVTFQ